MRTLTARDRVGLSLPPLLLRLTLAVTFIWAGLGKILAEMPVQGEAAAWLANMGVVKPAASPPVSAGEAPASRVRPTGLQSSEEGSQESPAPEDADEARTPPWHQPTYTAEDFPEPVMVRKVYGLALLLNRAADPPSDENGVTPMRLWPGVLARGAGTKAFAWVAALTELIAGFLLLIGLFTRLSALAVAGVMAVALWLTHIGPAMQTGDTFLWVLPAHGAFDVEAWRPFFWPLSLLMMGLALALAGPGLLALDNALFGSSHPDIEDHDEL